MANDVRLGIRRMVRISNKHTESWVAVENACTDESLLVFFSSLPLPESPFGPNLCVVVNVYNCNMYSACAVKVSPSASSPFSKKSSSCRDIGMLINQHSFSTAFCCLCWKIFLCILLLFYLFLTSWKLWKHLYNVNQSLIFFVTHVTAPNACEPEGKDFKAWISQHGAEYPLLYWETNEDVVTAPYLVGLSPLLVVRTSQCFSVTALVHGLWWM